MAARLVGLETDQPRRMAGLMGRALARVASSSFRRLAVAMWLWMASRCISPLSAGLSTQYLSLV